MKMARPEVENIPCGQVINALIVVANACCNHQGELAGSLNAEAAA